jgi:hypothetical protein
LAVCAHPEGVIDGIASDASTTKAARKSGLGAVGEGLEVEKLANEARTFIHISAILNAVCCDSMNRNKDQLMFPEERMRALTQTTARKAEGVALRRSTVA